MSLWPRLCSGAAIRHNVPAAKDFFSKSSSIFPRWKRRLRTGIQLIAVAGKHNGRKTTGSTRQSSPIPSELENTNTNKQSHAVYSKFDEMVSWRREQATRTLIVQVQSEASCTELRDYCENISPISLMFHYKLKENHYVLVEFKENCLPELLQKWCKISDKSTVPVASPVVWFKAALSGKRKAESEVRTDEDSRVTHIPPRPSYETILTLTAQATRVSNLMEILYNSTKLDELGTRLRFFTARQLELAMSGLFPHCAVLPFGSSVNGFGKAGSDLDLVFRHDISQSDHRKETSAERSLRLVYQTKASLGGPRPLTQRQMELLADILQVMMPGCAGVKRILQARVPIVKYSNDFTGLDCDLSMSNMTGVYMSELLFLFNQLDPLAKFLICFIKHWAAASQLTNPTPGRWITNFMLIMLCIHYLQAIKRLPHLDHMVNEAVEEDQRVTDDINCTFIRDLNRFDWTPSSSIALSKLLQGFFDFYVNFDFSSTSVSITTGARLSKPDHSALYIVNPLERSLNVAKNVSGEELERLRMGLRSASWALESGEQPINSLLTRQGPATISLPSLVQQSHRRFASTRLVTVKELFSDS